MSIKSPHEVKMELLNNEVERAKQRQVLNDGFKLADLFVNKNYLDKFSQAPIEVGPRNQIEKNNSLCIYRVKKIVFDPKEDVNDKLISVYSALNSIGSSVALMIKGSISYVDLYIVARLEQNYEMAGDILISNLLSNFPGIKYSEVEGPEREQLIETIGKDEKNQDMLNGLSAVSLIPSNRNKEKKDQYVQGLEKLINTLKGKEYLAVLLATPLDNNDILLRKHGLEELYSFLTPHAKYTYSYGENKSVAVNKGISSSFTSSVNPSYFPCILWYISVIFYRNHILFIMCHLWYSIFRAIL